MKTEEHALNLFHIMGLGQNANTRIRDNDLNLSRVFRNVLLYDTKVHCEIKRAIGFNSCNGTE